MPTIGPVECIVCLVVLTPIFAGTALVMLLTRIKEKPNVSKPNAMHSVTQTDVRPFTSIPSKNESSYVMNTYNEKGDVAGAVVGLADGRHTFQAAPNADLTSLIMSLSYTFADTLNLDEKRVIAKWAGLSHEEWGETHRSAYTHAFKLFARDYPNEVRNIPASAIDVISNMPTQKSLPDRLNKEMLDLFRKTYG
jgi:hypothetical protein